jgi:hypothetical protein
MASTELDLSATKPAKKPRIPRRVHQAIDLLLDGTCATQKAAALRVGISPEHLSRTLKKDHVRGLLREKVSGNIASMQMRAIGVMHSLLADAASEHVKKDVAFRALELNGFTVDRSAPTINITNNVVTPGYVLDLRSPEQIAAENATTIDHEPMG